MKIGIMKMLAWKELKDITPWNHNNYKTPKKLHPNFKVSLPPKKIAKKLQDF
jgi:hypothetical protein